MASCKTALLVLGLVLLTTKAASAHPHHRRRLQQASTDPAATAAAPTDPALTAALVQDPALAQQAAAAAGEPVAQAVPAAMPTEPLPVTTAPVDGMGVPGPPHLDPSGLGLNAQGVYRWVVLAVCLGHLSEQRKMGDSS